MQDTINQLLEISCDNKYTRTYVKIIARARLRGTTRKAVVQKFGYVEAHHIIPQSIRDDLRKNKDNIVYLTAKEHYICHLLLTKIFIKSSHIVKMIYAYRGFCGIANKNQSKRYSSRLYDMLKSAIKIKGAYCRIYKLNKVKYIPKDNTELLTIYIKSGWSYEMTPEYKVGRVGMMQGRKQTEHQKSVVSKLNRGTQKQVAIYKGIEKIIVDEYDKTVFDYYLHSGWQKGVTKEFRANTARVNHTNKKRSDETKQKIQAAHHKRLSNVEYKKNLYTNKRKSNIDYNVLALDDKLNWVYTDRVFPDPNTKLLSTIIKESCCKTMYVRCIKTNKKIRIPVGYGIPIDHFPCSAFYREGV